jgi:hypothetical protein
MSRHKNTEGESRLQTKERLKGVVENTKYGGDTLISSSHLNVLYKGLTQEKLRINLPLFSTVVPASIKRSFLLIVFTMLICVCILSDRALKCFVFIIH